MGRFSTEEEVIELANDTSYGLGAGLHSSRSRVLSQQRRAQTSDHMAFIYLADASQCMRVSSALEAGTVSDLTATSSVHRDAHCSCGDPTLLASLFPGLGEPIQYLEQQCSVWREETERNRYEISRFSTLWCSVLIDGRFRWKVANLESKLWTSTPP